MGDVEIYNKILKQVSDRITETLVHFQGELEIQRLERDRAVNRAEANQRKADSWRNGYYELKQAYERLDYQLAGVSQESHSWKQAAQAFASPMNSHPHYTSTYCIHGLHDECRMTCKTCGAFCLCEAEDCPCLKARVDHPEELVRMGLTATGHQPPSAPRLDEVGQAYVDAHPEVDWTSTSMTLKRDERGGYEVTGHRVLSPMLREALRETLGQVPIPPEAEPR